MNRRKMRIVLACCIVGIVVMLIAALPHQGSCYMECSPVIGVTNYSFFSMLLKNITQTKLVSSLKQKLAERIKLEYTPGSFASGQMNLSAAADISSVADPIIDEGRRARLNCVNTRMSVEAFTARLNRSVLAVMRQELQNRGVKDKALQNALADYQRGFLNSAAALGAYTGQVKDFQTMTAESVPESAKLLKAVTSMAGRMDVADGIRGRGSPGAIDNTAQAIEECSAHERGVIANVSSIAGVSITDSINTGFALANATDLRSRLPTLARTYEVVLSKEDVEKIIAKTNSVALKAVKEHIADCTGSFTDVISRSDSLLYRGSKTGIASAVAEIGRTMSAEKDRNNAAARLYQGIERQARGLIGDTANLGIIAREQGPLSITDQEGVKKLAALAAARNPSILQKRLTIAYYVAALASRETGLRVRTALSGFDPSSIDRAYDDAAWKDLARFNYYLLCLESQKLKLIALRAMSDALNSSDPYVVQHVEKSGLPEGL